VEVAGLGAECPEGEVSDADRCDNGLLEMDELGLDEIAPENHIQQMYLTF